MAVLKTSGTLNGCPCSVVDGKEGGKGIGAGAARKETGNGRRGSVESAASGGSAMSALDVYLGTRLGGVGSGSPGGH